MSKYRLPLLVMEVLMTIVVMLNIIDRYLDGGIEK